MKKKFNIAKLKFLRTPGYILLISLTLLALRIGPACGQESKELLTTISQKIGQSMQILTGYSFQQRTEVRVDGETKSVQLVQVTFGTDRQPLITPISSQPAEDTERGLRGRIKRDKAEEMKDQIQKLVQLSNSYLMPSQMKMQQLVREGKVMVNPDSGSIQVNLSGFIQTGDRVTLSCDGKTKDRLQIQVQTAADGNPVTITTQYQMLPTGLNYNAQTVIGVPSQALQIMINTMNYQQLITPSQVSAAQAPQDPGWPRQRIENGNALVTYQPQIDDWKDFREIEGRMAIELTPAGGKPIVGVVELKGDTHVDNDNKTVLITNLKIKKTYFPSLDSSTAAQMEQLTGTFLPQSYLISLHRLVACVPKKESAPGVQLKNDPPLIFVSYVPAILLDVDGQPVGVPVRNTDLEYVVNTRWRLFLDKTKSQYYLLAGEQWLLASSLEGPWSIAKNLPKDMDRLVGEPQWADLKKFIPPSPSKPNAVVPKVFYSTKPAEIILFDGKPAYAQIPGTRLQYATNTVSYLFFYSPTNSYYYLTAGRWFSASSLAGPWVFATPNLPADFAQIPTSSPAAQVLASVPGTEEAKDAVLLAQIPAIVVVNPAAAAAEAKVTYDGSPKFVPIEGTSMSYAANTAQKVIQVGDLYYLCLQGVWFVSPNPQGPWQTVQSVPQVIYSIPPSSPVYNVTYVTQTTISDGSVQASYTAGYMGAFVVGTAAGVIIAGGTGYYYPPYVGAYPVYGYPAYYPTPYTYGAASYHNSATGAYGVSQTAYGPYGSATRTASYNPYTGTSARTASASTAYGSAAVGQAYNPYTGAYGATKQGSNAYSQWGSSVVTKGGESAYTQHYTTAQGTAGSVQTSTGGKAAGASTAYGKTAAGKTASGDMYAGHDGNVYKNTGSGWEKYDNGSWNSVQKPSSTTPASTSQPRPATSTTQERPTTSQGTSAQQRSQGAEQQRPSSFEHQGGEEQMQGMQQEAQNRQRGEQSSGRFQQFQRSGGSSGGGERSFGGGSRGFGGSGRR